MGATVRVVGLVGWLMVSCSPAGSSDGGSGGTAGSGGAGGGETDALARVTGPAFAATCLDGGTELEYGFDEDRDGELDVLEVSGTFALCRGAGCTARGNGDGTSTVTCPNDIVLVVNSEDSPAVACVVGTGTCAGMPAADAGLDQNGVPVGTVATLDGSGSRDPDGGALTFEWRLASQPDANTGAGLERTDQVRPTLQAYVTGTYVVSLLVANAKLTSLADVIAVEAIANAPPLAVATCECSSPPVASCVDGICPALHGTAKSLIGSDSSDPEGVALTYSWSQLTTLAACQTACGGSFASCAPSGAGESLGGTVTTLTNRQQPTGTVVLPQVRDVHFVFQLEVSDGYTSDTACISYLTTNTVPSFFAPARQSEDDYNQTAGVAFDVECSPDADADGDTLDILWRQSAPPAPQALVSNPTAQQTSVTVPGGSITGDTVFFFEVEISDGVDTATQQVPGITVSP